MMPEDEVRGPPSPHRTHSSQVHHPYARHKQSKSSCLSPIPRNSVTSAPITAPFTAGVRDQDSRLVPASTGDTQSWGEVNAKAAHFTDVVAANRHYESR